MALLPIDGVLRPGETIRSVFLGPLNGPEVGAQVTLVSTDAASGITTHRHVYVASSLAGDDVVGTALAWCNAYAKEATQGSQA